MELRHAKAKPILDDLENWLQSELPKLSGKTPLANAIRYVLTRMKRLRGYFDHGFLELDNNTAERSMRGIAIGRKITCSWGPSVAANTPPSSIP